MTTAFYDHSQCPETTRPTNLLRTDAEYLPFGFIIPVTDAGGPGKRKRDVLNHISPDGSNPRSLHMVGEWNYENATIIFHAKKTMRTKGGDVEVGGDVYGDGFKTDSDIGDGTLLRHSVRRAHTTPRPKRTHNWSSVSTCEPSARVRVLVGGPMLDLMLGPTRRVRPPRPPHARIEDRRFSTRRRALPSTRAHSQ